jgi:hypothetical protein
MIVTLDAKRRVSIPAALAPAAPGDQFEASFDAEDDIVLLRRLKRKPNWLEVWKHFQHFSISACQLLYLSPNRAVAPKSIDEANRCILRHLTPKTRKKALHLGYS